MSEKVVPIGCITYLPIPVDTVLDAAKVKLDDVVLIGWDKKGVLYFASTLADCQQVLWLMEKAKTVLLDDETER
jgi:hypothetical protein